MQLIDNWKQALSMTSVQAGLLISALGFAEANMQTLQAIMSPVAYGWLGALVVVARLVVQKKLAK
jgi:hypothetical protein